MIKKERKTQVVFRRHYAWKNIDCVYYSTFIKGGGSANHYDLFCCLRRDTVMNVLREVDPHGVEMRRRRRINRRVYSSLGPNHVWHVDGCVLQTYKIYLSVHGFIACIRIWIHVLFLLSYDKLKPYGFSIHGCIDGYVIIYFAGGGADRI